MTSMPSYPGPPPSSWRGYFPGQQPPGFRVPPHYPHPPPMPPGYSYGERAWVSGSWVPAPGQHPDFNWGQRPPRKPPSADYWRQELKENPLELSGMIPAEELARRKKEAEEAARPAVPDSVEESTESSSMVWVPALTDAVDPSRGRDRRGLRRSRSSSQPPNNSRRERDRALSPTHHGASQAPQHSSTYPIMGPSIPFDDDDGVFDDPRKRTRPRAYRTDSLNRQAAAVAEERDRRGGPERNIRYSSEPPVDVGRVAEPESYLPGMPENGRDPLARSQSQSRSQQPPPLVQPDALHHYQHHPHHRHPFHAHNHARAASVDPYVSQGLTRSQTLPVDRIYSSSNLYSQADPPTSSCMYASQIPYDSRAAQMNLTPNRMGPQHQDGGRRWSQDESNSAQKESRNAERIRNWIAASNREILKAAHERAMHETERPQTRHTVEGYPYSRTPDRDLHHNGTPTRDGTHMRSAQKENVIRHSSLPASALQSDGAHMTNITEESEDLAGQFAKASLGDNRDDRSPLQKKPSNQSRALGRMDTLPADYDGERFVSPSRPEYSMGESSSSQMNKTSPSQYAQYVTPPITPTRQPQLYRQSDKGSSSTLNLPLSAQPSRSSLHQSASPAHSPYRQEHFSTPPTRVVHVTSNSFQTPARLQYLYRPENSPTSRPQQPYGASPKGSIQSPAHAPVRGQYSDPFDYRPENRSRSGSSSQRNSRSPSPLPPHASASMPNARLNNFPNSAHNTPARVPQGPVSNLPGKGQNPVTSRNSRNVRKGLWNRRGDHLTHDGFVVYCPPGRNFPSDLAEYPDDAFMDEYGKVVRERPERRPEHPDSIPTAGKSAVKPYDMFVEYVLVDR